MSIENTETEVKITEKKIYTNKDAFPLFKPFIRNTNTGIVAKILGIQAIIANPNVIKPPPVRALKKIMIAPITKGKLAISSEPTRKTLDIFVITSSLF